MKDYLGAFYREISLLFIVLLISCSFGRKNEQASDVSGQVLTRAQQLMGPNNFDLNQVLACYKSFNTDQAINRSRDLSLIVVPNQNGSYLAILPKEDNGTFSLSDFQSGSMEIRYFDNLRPVGRGHALPTYEGGNWYLTLTNGNLNNFMLRILQYGKVEGNLFLNSRLFTNFNSFDDTFRGTPVVCFNHSANTDDYSQLFVYQPLKEKINTEKKLILKKFSFAVDASIKRKTQKDEEHFFLTLKDLNKGSVSLKTRAVFDSNLNIVGYIESDNNQHFWKLSIRSRFNKNVKYDLFIRSKTPRRLTPECQELSLFVSPSGQEAICKIAMEKRTSDLENILNTDGFDLVKALDFGRPSVCPR
jgi:hypothetical protein